MNVGAIIKMAAYECPSCGWWIATNECPACGHVEDDKSTE